MSKIKFLIFGVAAFLAIFILFLSKKNYHNNSDLLISTESQNTNRISNFGTSSSSEDAFQALDESKLSIPDIEENIEYKADSDIQWILELVIPNDELITQEKLYKLFDYDWRTQFTSSIFGYSPSNGKWNYALAGGALEAYNKIHVAIDLVDPFKSDYKNFDSFTLKGYVLELEKRLKHHSLEYQIVETESKSKAIGKREKLLGLKMLFDKNVIMSLKADTSFNGKEVLEVLQNLGLQWGDGDLYHWNNSSDYASDHHFSVWTSTKPGYFIPAQIENSKLVLKDLVFGFSIPRSADPIKVFEIMLNCVEVCQKRLGGKIINEVGIIFDEKFERNNLKNLVLSMIDNKQIPGSRKVLKVY